MSDNQQSPPPKSGLSAFWAELKRRKVMRVAITYAVVAWLIMQVAGLTFEGFGVPIWAFRFVVIMLWLFFPVALIIAWAFELTPDGIKTTKAADEGRDDAPVSKKQQRKRNWFAVVFAAAVPTVIFGALAVFFYVKSGGDEETDIGEKSIAVLPLENMSPDPENAFFADGVQEDILTNLSKIEELLVISRTSTLGYRNTTKNLKQIGEELGVRYLVEGSVRRADNQILVTVQLIDTETDAHLWADSFNRSLDDIFIIQADIAKQIAGKLQTELSPEEVDKIEYRPTQNQEAYEWWVKYRQEEERGLNQAEQVRTLEKAVSFDSHFFEAWARLADETIILWSLRGRKDPSLFDKAHHALEQAKARAPDSPYIANAQAIFANIIDRDSVEAVNYALKALATDPSFRDAKRLLGNQYLRLGRFAEAQHYWESAFSTDPLSRTSNRALITIYASRGNMDQARMLIQANLKRNPDDLEWLEWMIGLDYWQYGDREAYVKALNANSNSTSGGFSKARIALISREYSTALHSLSETASPNSSFGIFQSGRMGTLSIYPIALLKALLHFEMGHLEQRSIESSNSKKSLEALLKSPEIDEIGALRNSLSMAICYALEGDRLRMEAILDSTREAVKLVAKKWSVRESVRSDLNIAIAYIVLGDHDKAIETLEAASKMDGPLFLNRELDLWFIFDRLRGNPRFDALLED